MTIPPDTDGDHDCRTIASELTIGSFFNHLKAPLGRGSYDPRWALCSDSGSLKGLRTVEITGVGKGTKVQDDEWTAHVSRYFEKPVVLIIDTGQ